MNDLGEVFKSLSSMVVEQGTVLDRVDFNVLKARDDLKKANKELKKTLSYEDNKRARGC